MEASLKKFKELFELEDTDIRTYSPLTLAYIGDAIYELVIRTILVEKGNTQVNKLHQRASKLVKASAQSEIIENRRRNGNFQKRKKCKILYHGKKCQYVRLQKSYGI